MPMTSTKKKQEQAELARKRKILQNKYNKRITTARKAREAYIEKNYVEAMKGYQNYLSIHAERHELKDFMSIAPKHFDPKRDVTEMLLISHVFWEMSRIYVLTPKFEKKFAACLYKFVDFTVNQPYQVLNSEMLRKHIKKNRMRGVRNKELQAAYQKIFVKSKKCYVATHAYGENHYVTNELRIFKNNIATYSLGKSFIRFYYNLSPQLVLFLQKNQFINKTLNPIIKTCLSIIAMTFSYIRRSIVYFK